MKPWFVASLTLLFVGCAAPLVNPPTVHDSTGLEFGWSCPPSGDCQLTSIPMVSFPPPSCTGSRAAWEIEWGRFFQICVACATATEWSALEADCRPLGCSVDTDCPQFEDTGGTWVFACVSHLCQDTDLHRSPRDTLDRTAAGALCYATQTRDSTAGIGSPAASATEAALDATCPGGGTSCTLPASCSPP